MSKRTLLVVSYYSAAFAVPAFIMAGMMWLPKAWLPGPTHIIVPLIAVAAALPLAGRAWHLSDEAAREAHKSAFFCGGSFGAMLGLIGLSIWISLATDPKERAADFMGLWSGALPQEPHNLILIGAIGILLVQLAGYALAWAMWWLRSNAISSERQ